MVLVLVIGDFHSPFRSYDIPNEFKKLLAPGRIQQILCTGNLCDRETYEFLRNVCSDLQVVQGDFDEVGAWPVNKTITHGDYKFGLIHGHQIIPFGDRASLAAYARQLDVDVLISGHTHQLEIRKEDGKLFVNPGTVTGAESQFGGEPFPSFMLMDVQDTITIYIYIYKDGGYIVQTEKYSKD